MEGKYRRVGCDLKINDHVTIKHGDLVYLGEFVFDNQYIWYVIHMRIGGQDYGYRDKCSGMRSFRSQWHPV